MESIGPPDWMQKERKRMRGVQSFSLRGPDEKRDYLTRKGSTGRESGFSDESE